MATAAASKGYTNASSSSDNCKNNGNATAVDTTTGIEGNTCSLG